MSFRPGLLVLLFAACGAPKPRGTGVAELGGFGESMHGAAVRDSLRQFADSVSVGVSREGPAGWRRFLSHGAEFLMVVDGKVEFPNGDSAFRAIDGLAKSVTRLTLNWNGELRLDALAPGLGTIAARWSEIIVDTAGKTVSDSGYFTGLAEHRPDGWRFRNAEWMTDKR